MAARWTRVVAGLLGLVVAGGCGNDGSGGGGGAADGGGGGGDAGDPAACFEPDRECPVDPPITGGPCEGALECDFPEYVFRCVDGAWVDEPLCDGGCAPPLAEACRVPFSGTLDGATVQIGPAADGAFVPFADGEHIDPVFGAQGATMMALRIRVDADAPPECLGVAVTVSLDGTEGPPANLGIVAHCGETRRIYAILPDNPCEFRDYDVQLSVDVDGVGSAAASLVLAGGGCPRTL